MLIRPSQDNDIAACVDLVREVHAVDRYPRYLPDDLRSFLVPRSMYGAWVADADGQVVGHVALVPPAVRSVAEVASKALDKPESELAVVARLFVSPRVRGAGAGGRLLDTAAADAVSRGLWPVLDVAADLTSAIAMYEGHGWVRAGEVVLDLGEGRLLNEYVYLGPVTQ